MSKWSAWNITKEGLATPEILVLRYCVGESTHIGVLAEAQRGCIRGCPDMQSIQGPTSGSLGILVQVRI